jgi:hypothetical protein
MHPLLSSPKSVVLLLPQHCSGGLIQANRMEGNQHERAKAGFVSLHGKLCTEPDGGRFAA